MVMENNLSKGWDQFSVSPMNFYDWRDQNQVSSIRGNSRLRVQFHGRG